LNASKAGGLATIAIDDLDALPLAPAPAGRSGHATDQALQ
jgi:hypothetical protein